MEEINKNQGRKEMFYSMMHSTHFTYRYMASDNKIQVVCVQK